MTAALDHARLVGLEYFVDSLRWDETLHVFALDQAGLLRSQARKKWSVSRAKVKVYWLLSDGSESCMDLVCPPVVCVGSITAGCLWDALHCTKHAAVIAQFIRDMRALAGWHWCCVRE